jgi:hypothetical protein
MQCDSGFYQPNAGQPSCQKCSPGSYNPNIGSTSASSCQKCSPGFYQPNAGQSTCMICSVGTSSEAGQLSCQVSNQCSDPASSIIVHFKNTLISALVTAVGYGCLLFFARSKSKLIISFSILFSLFELCVLAVDLSTDIIYVYLIFSSNLLPANLKVYSFVLGTILLVLRIVHPVVSFFICSGIFGTSSKYSDLVDKGSFKNTHEAVITLISTRSLTSVC